MPNLLNFINIRCPENKGIREGVGCNTLLLRELLEMRGGKGMGFFATKATKVTFGNKGKMCSLYLKATSYLTNEDETKDWGKFVKFFSVISCYLRGSISAAIGSLSSQAIPLTPPLFNYSICNKLLIIKCTK